jgi:hypothetical protein
LNRGPHRPERCALPGCATPRTSQYSTAAVGSPAPNCTRTVERAYGPGRVTAGGWAACPAVPAVAPTVELAAAAAEPVPPAGVPGAAVPDLLAELEVLLAALAGCVVDVTRAFVLTALVAFDVTLGFERTAEVAVDTRGVTELAAPAAPDAARLTPETADPLATAPDAVLAAPDPLCASALPGRGAPCRTAETARPTPSAL